MNNHDLCEKCPMRHTPPERLDVAAATIESCIRYMGKKQELLMQARLERNPDAVMPEGNPKEIRDISAKDLQQPVCPIERVVTTDKDNELPRIWVAITFDDLPPMLKALLLILKEDGPGATANGIVPWKTHDQILKRLPPSPRGPRKRGAVRQLKLRLRDEFERRGLHPDLIETETKRLRLMVRSTFAAPSTAPHARGSAHAPACDESHPV
jgi:hypothetical protein